jgi:cellulose synthase/poly-beta-1,6-N-acetylglucosamine synthase-like glycosyltransferase
MIAALEITQWFCLVYVGVMNIGYLTLTVVSFVALGRYTRRHSLEGPEVYSDFEPPVTVIVPAYNEELTVVASVRSLLQLRHPQFEVIVVNDGSKDRTLAALIEAFDLSPFPEVLRVRLKTTRVRTVYRSPVHPELRVIDKENGGKADALNAGINAARFPLFCALDADGILQPDSLRRVVRPFKEDSRTVATGGIIRIANGCDVVGGWLVRASPPRTVLGLLQVVEYCRAFLFGRLGWNPLNGVLVISGAFGVFHKETVVGAGGYRTDVVGEDMELVVRLHRLLRRAGRTYRITFVPDPVCWTEAPDSLRVLRRQRVRWQRGLCESLALNMDLMLSGSGGCVGWIAFPFALIFECLSPLIETLGYILVVAGYLSGSIDLLFAIGFLIVSIGLGVVLSASSLLLDEMSFQTYPKARHIAALLLASVVENLGYRQVNAIWRLEGLLRWAMGARQVWGEMTRSAGWSTTLTPGGTSSWDRS